jgi:N-methylhydantoinase B
VPAAVSSAAPLVRELADEEFAARYGCDRLTATVLANRFRYVVEHMCGKLLTTAFSPILRDFYDFAATISGPPDAGYPTPAMSSTIVLFTGTMTDSVRNTIEEYGVGRLEPGDVIVANDPYRTGTHVNDLLFCRPVFHEGELAALVNLQAHQLDMGGVVPGGFSLAKRNVYENGLVLSPRPLMKGGEPVSETWSLIFDNVRFGAILLPDMQTVCAGLELGERLLDETLRRYGATAVTGAMAYVCDSSAERMSVALAALPDGEWEGEDALDCDGVDDSEEYRVHVRVVKRGGRAEIDFSGTSRQARTCINATALDVKSSVGIGLKFLLDPDGPFTSGTTRCVDLVIPEGTVVSALPPDGAVFAYWEQSQVVLSALLRAMAQAVGDAAMAGDRGSPDIHNANGVLPDGTPWISVAQCGGEIGGYGANRHGDADSQMLSYQANGIAPAIEAIESDAPVAVLRHEIVPDTAGAGYNRGGASVLRDSLWLEEAEHHLMSLRYKRPSGFGVRGGREGASGGIWLWEPAGGGFEGLAGTGLEAYRDAIPVGGVLDPETNFPSREGEYRYFLRVPSWRTRPLSVLRYVTCAGGGFGDPLAREPERVKRDVRDGYVTIAGAARDYGVVISGDPDEDPEGLAVDLEATERLRRSLRASPNERS